MIRRLQAARRARRTRRHVTRLARTHTAIWLTTQTATLQPPAAFDTARCHICQTGHPTLTDPYTGDRCCDHCGAPTCQYPGATPTAGVPATVDHQTGVCGCRSLHRPDLDARETDRSAAHLQVA